MERLTGRQVLERLSSATGGHAYQVTHHQPLEKIYSYIEQEMRTQYVLGYTPEKSDAGPGYRKLVLKANDKSWQVQTRSGYYSSKPKDAPVH